jgi:hypothetical protein
MTNVLNSGDGVLDITAPLDYSAGDTLSIVISLAKTGQSRWGFEATVLDLSDQPVGEFLVTDPTNTQAEIDIGGRHYIKHTLTGTSDNTPNVAPGWSFKWIAPATPAGHVVFYVAGNAANSNDFNTGDFIYTTSKTVEQVFIPCCIATRGNANNDPEDKANVADVSYLVSWLFGIPPGPAPECIEEANANGDPDEKANVADVSYLVSWLFGIPSGPPPPACP